MATRKKSSKRSAKRPSRVPRRPSRTKPRSSPPPPAPVVPLDPRVEDAIECFNFQRFADCRVWLERAAAEEAPRTQKFSQGLIEAAAAFEHWSTGNRPGALALARSATARLKTFRPSFQGIDIEEFVTKFAELFGWLRRHRLRYDARLAPKIRRITGRAQAS